MIKQNASYMLSQHQNWINNSLLYGVCDTLLNRLQIIQHAAARLLTKTPKQDHITPILKQIHWLPVSQCIIYKILLLVFKSLHGMAPSYIKGMLMQKPILIITNMYI